MAQRALLRYTETYKIPKAIKPSISNATVHFHESQDLCDNYDPKWKPETQKSWGRIFSSAFKIRDLQLLANCVVQGKILNFPNVNSIVISAPLMNYMSETEERGRESQLIHATRKVLCKSTASSWPTLRKLIKIITITGDGFSLLFCLGSFKTTTVLKESRVYFEGTWYPQPPLGPNEGGGCAWLWCTAVGFLMS